MCPQMEGIGRTSACGICLASNSLSTGGKYVSVAAGTRIVRALIDDNAFSKSPAKRGCAGDIVMLPGPNLSQEIVGIALGKESLPEGFNELFD